MSATEEEDDNLRRKTGEHEKEDEDVGEEEKSNLTEQNFGIHWRNIH